MTRRKEDLMASLRKQPEDTYYKFQEAKYFSDIDPDTHADRIKSLSESYNPITLNAYLNYLVPQPDQRLGDSIPHSTVFDSLRPFTSSSPPPSIPKYESSSHPKPRVAKSATIRSNIVRRYQHLGSWSVIPNSDGEYAWSCCLSNDKNSRGCTHTIDNRDRWNLSAPTE